MDSLLRARGDTNPTSLHCRCAGVLKPLIKNTLLLGGAVRVQNVRERKKPLRNRTPSTSAPQGSNGTLREPMSWPMLRHTAACLPLGQGLDRAEVPVAQRGPRPALPNSRCWPHPPFPIHQQARVSTPTPPGLGPPGHLAATTAKTDTDTGTGRGVPRRVTEGPSTSSKNFPLPASCQHPGTSKM